MSQAVVSRSRPPMTACSASTECGGTGASTVARGSRRALAGPATDRLLFRDDQHRQRNINVGVQVQTDVMFADHAQGASRHAHFATLDLEARLAERLGDIGRADGAEQLAFRAGLRGHRELEVLQGIAPLFSGSQMLTSSLLELIATSLKARHVVRGG